MTREELVSYLSIHLETTESKINEAFAKAFEKYHNNCCQELIHEALDYHELMEYRACRQFFEYLMLGEKNGT